MDGKRGILIAGAGIVALIALVAFYFLGGSSTTDGDVVIGPDGQPIAQAGDPGENGPRGARGGRRRNGRPGAKRAGGAAAGGAQGEDTGPDPNGPDTGVTREQLIDEMIEDVAKDTGLNDEGKDRMREALLRIRDEAAAAAAAQPTPVPPQ